jgi:hypothetical protein
METMMRRLPSLASLATFVTRFVIPAAGLCACGVVTGIDDYEIVDCPDGGSSCSADGSTGPSATDGPASDGPVKCGDGQVLLTIVVVGEDSVTLRNPPLNVSAGSNGSVCVTSGALLNATANTDRDTSWSYTPMDCRQNRTDCTFSISADTTITVTIRN